ncbi:hypothetical protein [Micromonospora sp. KC723]|uniref:hypothetical protein n=1 Tax=Micromonospora sp. KC723 TaxID=2530381 RepID=UPI0010487FE6|nr:hypothetical protein [Micromonospora sp. KC723]TDB76280.1 hypothetical protein E1165_07790 [Micromonospora sp. KC723]
MVAAPTVLVLAAGALPERVALFVSPESDLWRAAHERWAAVLAVALVRWPGPAATDRRALVAGADRQPLCARRWAEGVPRAADGAG